MFNVPQLVIFEAPKGYENHYPWRNGDHMLFMGEITNMPGHCVIVNKEGKTFWGYHTDNFREPREDEL
jgi:hypothetical protein